ncbi:hypothetical protein PFISCL1PPCAC_21374, partial [Pristionchus fissidentatus]
PRCARCRRLCRAEASEKARFVISYSADSAAGSACRRYHTAGCTHGTGHRRCPRGRRRTLLVGRWHRRSLANTDPRHRAYPNSCPCSKSHSPATALVFAYSTRRSACGARCLLLPARFWSWSPQRQSPRAPP